MFFEWRGRSKEVNDDTPTEQTASLSFKVSPPMERRPASSNPRRVRASLQMATTSSCTSDDRRPEPCDTDGPSRRQPNHPLTVRVRAPRPSNRFGSTASAGDARPSGLVRRRELGGLAAEYGWQLAWPLEEGVEFEAPDTSMPILVVHRQGQDIGTSHLLRRLREATKALVPILVLLLDVGGTLEEERRGVLVAQREFMSAGADNVLVNRNTPEELRLAVDMELQRSEHAAKWRAAAQRDVDEQLGKADEVAASGLFWQCVDRVFTGFPLMESRLPADLKHGTRVGHCVFESALGQGSFGKVYGATNLQTGTREAVKVISKSSIKSVKHVSAVHREMRMHARLEHRHIIALHGVMHGPLHLFLRMEEASKGNLFVKLKAVAGALPVEDTKRYQGQLASAVAYCHKQGVAHRDLKPENIAFDASGRDIKVLDFGCAVIADRPRTDVVGSFPFMAPEVFVASSSAVYEPKHVDVWACAVILLEMMCGVHQLNRMLGWARSTAAAPERKAELVEYFSDEFAIRRVVQGCFGQAEGEGDLEALLRGAMEVEPERRWSAAEMAESPWLC